jgi:hypothetical protein
MWVKGAMMHFIVNSGIQNNLISTKVAKWLDLPIKPHTYLTPLGGSTKGEISASTNNVACPME